MRKTSEKSKVIIDTLKPWKVTSSHEVFKAAPWVRVCVDQVKLPSGRVVDDFYRVKLLDYVLIYGRNNQEQVLAVHQYRHIPKKIILDLPAGAIEHKEDPLVAAKRELLEETGYCAPCWQSLGTFLLDGNKVQCHVHFFLADGLTLTASPIKDDMEESRIVFIDEALMIGKIFKGDFPVVATNAIILLAASLKRKKRNASTYTHEGHKL